VKSNQPIPTLKTGHAHSHPDPISGAKYSAVEMMPGDRAAILLDQRKLPREERYEHITTVEQMAYAIESLLVRGAPAIGIAAAYGMVLAASPDHFLESIAAAHARLRATRPTAVNLAWALDRMLEAARTVADRPHAERLMSLGTLARTIHKEDVAACKKMGALGQELFPARGTVLTHCNAGALATGGYGTALGVIRAAREAGKDIDVYAAETRPVLQGARLTAWELARDGVPVTLVSDTAVAQLMARRKVGAVIVGADRIARSGDVANKIGTYGIACLAHLHEIPLYVAAPFSTVDLACESGAQIPIEERSPDEVTELAGAPIAPEGIRVENPAFDVTPARLVRAIITERGVVAPAAIASLG
jgi:methylthioribose-1-phosphate isomerase